MVSKSSASCSNSKTYERLFPLYETSKYFTSNYNHSFCPLTDVGLPISSFATTVNARPRVNIDTRLVAPSTTSVNRSVRYGVAAYNPVMHPNKASELTPTAAPSFLVHVNRPSCFDTLHCHSITPFICKYYTINKM